MSNKPVKISLGTIYPRDETPVLQYRTFGVRVNGQHYSVSATRSVAPLVISAKTGRALSFSWQALIGLAVEAGIDIEASESPRDSEVLAVLKAQHEAIDRLFSALIMRTSDDKTRFMPSESGQPWEACKRAHALIGRLQHG